MNTEEQVKIKRAELAFEDGFDESPDTLWRVYSTRDWKDRGVRHVNWFATESAALAHAAWINDGRGRVDSVTRYVKATGESSTTE